MAIIPPCLHPTDPVAIVAPSGVVDKVRLRHGLTYLRRHGHSTVLAHGLLSRCGYLAGTDDHRAHAFNEIIAEARTKAILFARGGYGMGRILDRLDLRQLRRRPRLLVGYSDLTALFLALQRDGPYVVHYGPVVSELGDARAFDEGSFWASLYGDPRRFSLRLKSNDVLKPGRGVGRLIGGCLSLMVSLLGTRHDPDYDGAILFWEEVSEAPYRIDRMLTQLKNAGKLNRLRGMIVGSLSGCLQEPGKPSLTIRRILHDLCREASFPIVWNVPAGHVAHKITLPMGLPAVLDTAARSLSVQRRLSR